MNDADILTEQALGCLKHRRPQTPEEAREMQMFAGQYTIQSWNVPDYDELVQTTLRDYFVSWDRYTVEELAQQRFIAMEFLNTIKTVFTESLGNLETFIKRQNLQQGIVSNGSVPDASRVPEPPTDSIVYTFWRGFSTGRMVHAGMGTQPLFVAGVNSYLTPASWSGSYSTLYRGIFNINCCIGLISIKIELINSRRKPVPIKPKEEEEGEREKLENLLDELDKSKKESPTLVGGKTKRRSHKRRGTRRGRRRAYK